jgi:uncharacterized protein (TIGR02246 family)
MTRWMLAAVFALAHSPGAFASDAVPQQVRQLAERYTSAWCSQKPESVAAHYAEDGSLTINDGEPSIGRAAITEAARSFMSGYPDMVVRMDGLDRQGDGYRYRWTFTGTNSGPGGTGHEVRISGYEEWTLGADGLIEKSLGHYVAADWDRQLGRILIAPTS